MYISAQPFDKLQDRARFRLDDSFHHNLAGSIPDRHRNAFLVHVHTDIFSAASHKRVFLSGWFVASTQTLLQKGHPLYCVSDRRSREVARQAPTRTAAGEQSHGASAYQGMLTERKAAIKPIEELQCYDSVSRCSARSDNG